MEGLGNVLKVSELNNSVKERAYQESLHGKYEVWRDGEVESVERVKGKGFYGQEPPSGESTTTEYGLNYQLLVAMY